MPPLYSSPFDGQVTRQMSTVGLFVSLLIKFAVRLPIALMAYYNFDQLYAFYARQPEYTTWNASTVMIALDPS